LKINIFDYKQFNILKKTIYLILLLIICLNCSPTKTFTKESDIKAIVENRQLNILYRGVRNHLNIDIPQSDSIQVSGAGVKKEGKNRYSVVPTTGTTLEITISGFIRDKVVTDKRKFRILNIGRPFASINNQTIQINLTNEELALSKIKYFIPQLVYELPKVGKFHYQINQEESLINYGEEFNQSAKDRILKMKSGDSIVIDELSLENEQPNIDYKKVNALKVIIQ
jgi:hypothetical protein